MIRFAWPVVVGIVALFVRAEAADFPKPYNTEPAENGAPQSPQQTAAGIKTPDGFRVGVFAAEPDVCNPISMAWDGRGRLWIAENYTYAEGAKKFELGLRDRVLIFEDTDGDGRQDRRTVFTDDVQMLTSVEVGHGGVWLMCPPQLLFIPDRDGDDKPDAPAEVVLDGFEPPEQSYHNFANGLHWGPDGWLYGRAGASAPGQIGAPGTPESARVPIRGGVWRYHPTRKTFEALCYGTTNPWGHDWNEHGEAFFVNTVNGHLWHLIPGAHLRRPHTIDPNPRVYDTIDQHADHYHWDTGGTWADSRKKSPENDRLGGGHAHIGAMIYQADQWPSEYGGKIMTLNQHGRRVNVDRLEREGSGYVGRHEPDILQASDPWFRAIELSYGPDGSVYILDWSDSGECHERDGVHRTSGRIYRVTYSKSGDVPKTSSVDLTKASDEELVELHKHSNEWYARQARKLLVNRNLADGGPARAPTSLLKLAQSEGNVVHRLRAIWTLHSLGFFDAALRDSLLKESDEHLRVWGIRLSTDTWSLDTVMGPIDPRRSSVDPQLVAKFVEMARTDKSGLVRLTLASTLQRLPVSQRAELATALAAHDEDARDHNLPYMVWYGLIPVADVDPQRLVTVASKTSWPQLRQWIARRLSENLAKKPDALNALLAAAAKDSDKSLLGDVLSGMTEGLAGWHKAPQPKSWPNVQAAVAATGESKWQEQARGLSVLFGDGRALDEVRALALDKNADLKLRRAALEALIEANPKDLRKICESLIKTKFLNLTAMRGLSKFNDPEIGTKLAASYKQFHHSERDAILETLVSRPVFARALLDEMAQGDIPRDALTAFQARQIRSFNDADLTKRLIEVWGDVRDSSADNQKLLAELKHQLTPEVIAQADAGRGRAIYNTACAACHRLYGHGGEVGPDLTGAGRQNLDYVLSNIIDPSSVVTADFRMSIVQLADGRILNGIIRAQTDRTVTLQTAKERVALDRQEIEALEPSPLSLMPEGLLKPLSAEQIRDLTAYLMSRSQVPLPEGVPDTTAAGQQ
jgi:putative membrane-bound dehydrogenase-like protein